VKDTTTDNALLLPPIEEVAVAFQSKEALEAVICKIEEACRAEHHTIATRDGRERIKSQAYKISRSKTALDEVGKGLTEEARKLIDNTNALRKIATTRLDALKEEIRQPLTDWEAAEDARKQEIKDRINFEFGMRALPVSSAALRAIQSRVVIVELDETFGEFLADAVKAKDAFLRHLEGKIQEAVREEEREAENARLRAELEAMEQVALPIEPVAEAMPVIQPLGSITISASDIAASEITPVSPERFQREIGAAIFAIIDKCHTRQAMADEVAAAIVAGIIPHVEVAQ
jgi:hypothetical protein